jgi:hypothetical protein
MSASQQQTNGLRAATHCLHLSVSPEGRKERAQEIQKIRGKND